MLVKPTDHEAVCHASASITKKTCVRLKMCIQVNEEYFTTVHHELGHNSLSDEVTKRNAATFSVAAFSIRTT